MFLERLKIRSIAPLILVVELVLIIVPLVLMYVVALFIGPIGAVVMLKENLADPQGWFLISILLLGGFGLHSLWILWEAIYLRDVLVPRFKRTMVGLVAGTLLSLLFALGEAAAEIVQILFLLPVFVTLHLLLIAYFRKMF